LTSYAEVAVAGALDGVLVSEGYAALGAPLVEHHRPEPLRSPLLGAFSPSAAESLGLPHSVRRDDDFLSVAAGAATFRTARPYAAGYSGRHIGVRVPTEMGDGRVITLGELATPDGGVEWQLKGGGRTRFSRGRTGRVTLAEAVREYVLSETLHRLGVPTTRSLAIVVSTDPTTSIGANAVAVLSRLTPSAVRFGTFEYALASGGRPLLRKLCDYFVTRFHPDLLRTPEAERDALLLHRIVAATAGLLAAWEVAGFVHGMLRTDNLSALGLTLDYDTCTFLQAPRELGAFSLGSAAVSSEREREIVSAACELLAVTLSGSARGPDDFGVSQHFRQSLARERFARTAATLGLNVVQHDDMRLVEELFALVASCRTELSIVLDAALRTRGDCHEDDRDVPSRWHGWLARYRERRASPPLGGTPSHIVASIPLVMQSLSERIARARYNGAAEDADCLLERAWSSG
jgi:serine/tyrosine/threonine adenylyltransferase